MRANRKDRLKHKINQGQGSLEETLDKNVLERDSEEFEDNGEDANKQVAKTFKHLGKAGGIKF
jgi:hypothetical protein